MTSIHTHKSHPVTSFLAAESVNGVTELQGRILALFGEHGAMTHEKLVERYNAQYGKWWPAAESGIRSRCKDLADRNLILDTGKKEKNKRNRDAILWNIADGRLF